MQGSFGPGRGRNSGYRPSHNAPLSFATDPVRRSLLFWISEPFVGKVRRETPAKFHYWLCILKVMLPPAVLAGWWVYTVGRVSADSVEHLAPALVLISCGLSAYEALKIILFDAEAREVRKLAKKGRVPLPHVYPSANDPCSTRAGYQQQESRDLMKGLTVLILSVVAFVVGPRLSDLLPPLMPTVASNHLSTQMLAVMAILIGTYLCGVAAANLLFGGFEMMREQGLREGYWRGEMP